MSSSTNKNTMIYWTTLWSYLSTNLVIRCKVLMKHQVFWFTSIRWRVKRPFYNNNRKNWIWGRLSTSSEWQNKKPSNLLIKKTILKKLGYYNQKNRMKKINNNMTRNKKNNKMDSWSTHSKFLSNLKIKKTKISNSYNLIRLNYKKFLSIITLPKNNITKRFKTSKKSY
jgi:hypothetical protein